MSLIKMKRLVIICGLAGLSACGKQPDICKALLECAAALNDQAGLSFLPRVIGPEGIYWKNAGAVSYGEAQCQTTLARDVVSRTGEANFKSEPACAPFLSLFTP